MKIVKQLFAVVIPVFILQIGDAQEPMRDSAKFDQHKVFFPLFYPGGVNEYRSASGMPGPKYWQNRADYKIDVSLDTAGHRIEGTTVISYTNNSPDKINFLWLQLDQNVFREDARHASTNSSTNRKFTVLAFTKGNEIKSVNIIRNGKKTVADWIVNDTRMQIKLADTLGSGVEKFRLKSCTHLMYLKQMAIPGWEETKQRMAGFIRLPNGIQEWKYMTISQDGIRFHIPETRNFIVNMVILIIQLTRLRI